MLKSFFMGLTAIYLSITGVFHAPKTIPPVIATSTPSEQTAETTSAVETSAIGAVATTSAKSVNVREKSAPTNTATPKPVQTPAKISVPAVPPVSTQPVKQQPTGVSSDEQAAITYFNTHDSCNSIPDKLLSFCAAYSLNHVSDLAKQRKAELAVEADRLFAERAAERKKAQDELDASRPARISSLNKEYGLKINALQAHLIEANSLEDSSGMKAKEILRMYGNKTGVPDFADTSFKQQVIQVIYTKLDTVNPVARDSGHVVNFLREETSALNTQIAQLQNELERKLLELQ